jgi:hypothetical protein
MKKTFASAITAVFLAIILATVAFAAPNNQAVPFKGTWQAQEVILDPGPPTALHGIATGNATQLGGYTISYYPVVDLPTATTSGTIVAANGDTLTFVGTGLAEAAGGPGEFDIVEQWTITGGTGRFVGASGHVTLQRHLSALTLASSGAFDGTIVLAH